MESTRDEILKLLGVLGELYPEWRFGQMVANVVVMSGETNPHAIWDVDDVMFLETVRRHVANKSRA